MAEHEPPPGGSAPPGVSNAERRVLRSPRDHDPSTIRQPTERRDPSATTGNSAPVQKRLERLEKDRPSRVARDRSLAPILTDRVRTESLSAKERSEFHKLPGCPGLSPGRP